MDTLKIRINATGIGSVHIGDTDLSQSIRGFRINSVVGELAEIELLALANVEIEIEDVKCVETTSVGSKFVTHAPVH